MANTIQLPAEIRDEFGKGAARRIRRADKIPAVLYGHGTDPIHITLPGHETMMALRQANVLLTLQMPDGQEQLALPKQVQRHPVRPEIEHVDLLLVKRGERVTVAVPLVVSGELASSEAVINQERTEVNVSAEATHIPAELQVSVEGLNIGDHILAGSIKLPDGVDLAEDPEDIVVVITAPASQVAEETGEESAEVSEDAPSETQE